VVRHHYRDLLTWESGGAGPSDRPATPLNYLDKIFQIPTAQPPSATAALPTAALPAEDRPSPVGPEGEHARAPQPGSLVLRAPESGFMVRLGPLLSTPRAARRRHRRRRGRHRLRRNL